MMESMQSVHLPVRTEANPSLDSWIFLLEIDMAMIITIVLLVLFISHYNLRTLATYNGLQTSNDCHFTPMLKLLKINFLIDTHACL